MRMVSLRNNLEQLGIKWRRNSLWLWLGSQNTNHLKPHPPHHKLSLSHPTPTPFLSGACPWPGPKPPTFDCPVLPQWKVCRNLELEDSHLGMTQSRASKFLVPITLVCLRTFSIYFKSSRLMWSDAGIGTYQLKTQRISQNTPMCVWGQGGRQQRK